MTIAPINQRSISTTDYESNAGNNAGIGWRLQYLQITFISVRVIYHLTCHFNASINDSPLRLFELACVTIYEIIFVRVN